MHIDKKKTQIAILAVLGCALIGSAAFQFFPQQKTAPQRPRFQFQHPYNILLDIHT